MKKDINFWLIQVPGCAFNYETGVDMGTQEPADVVSDVGVAFWYGFAFADLVT